jgi:hypothetical protein
MDDLLRSTTCATEYPWKARTADILAISSWVTEDRSLWLADTSVWSCCHWSGPTLPSNFGRRGNRSTGATAGQQWPDRPSGPYDTCDGARQTGVSPQACGQQAPWGVQAHNESSGSEHLSHCEYRRSRCPKCWSGTSHKGRSRCPAGDRQETARACCRKSGTQAGR